MSGCSGSLGGVDRGEREQAIAFIDLAYARRRYDSLANARHNMSGSADRQSPAEILVEGLGKIEDAQKIKAAFPYLPHAAVSILLRGLQAEGIKDVDAWL